MRPPIDLSLYLVTDEAQCRSRGRTTRETVLAAVDGGATCVQLRAKGTDGGSFLAEVLDIAEAVGRRVPVIVNDRVDVLLAARELGAPVAGVHLGQSDLPVGVVRRLIGEEALIGLSAATPAQLCAAEGGGACDYVGIGTVRATRTKTNAPAGLGVDGVGALAALTALPAVAIGGIAIDDLPGLRAAGLEGAAVVSAICLAEDPRDAAARLREAWGGGGPA